MNNLQKVVFSLFHILSFVNKSEVGCLEMLGVGGPEWAHRSVCKLVFNL